MQWEYAIFAVLISAFYLQQELVRQRSFRKTLLPFKGDLREVAFLTRQIPAAAVLILALLLGGGWWYIDHQETQYLSAIREADERSGTRFALELEQMGHEQIPTASLVKSARQVEQAMLLGHWLKQDTRIEQMYTFRKQLDGSLVFVLEPVLSVNADPEKAKADRERLLSSPEAERAFSGETVFLVPSLAAAGESPALLLIPLRTAVGTVEAVLGMNFFPQDLQASLVVKRYGVMGAVAFLILLLNSIYWIFSRMSLDPFLIRRYAAEIAESEQRFRNLANHAPVLLQVTDPQGDSYFFNQTWLEFVGQPSELQVGRGWFQFIHPEDLEGFITEYDRAFAERTPFQTEFRLHHAARGYCWMMATFVPRWQQDAFAGFMGSAVDIGDHKQLEQTLQYQVDLEKIVATVSAHFVSVSTAKIGAAITQALGEIGPRTGVDRAYLFLYSEDLAAVDGVHTWYADGISSPEKELPNIPPSQFSWLMDCIKNRGGCNISRVDEMSCPEARAAKEYLQDREVKSLLILPLTHGGCLVGSLGLESVRREKRWTEEEIQLIRLVGEVLINALQRRWAEIALQRSEAKNNAILDALPDIMYQVDRQGIILDLKCAKQQPFAGRISGLLGASISELIPSHLLKPALDAIDTALATGEVQVFEYYQIDENKTDYFEARVIRASDDDVLLIVRDVSERRRSELCDLLLLDIAMKVLEEQPLDEILSFAGQQIMAVFGLKLLWIGRKEAGGSIRLFSPGDEVTDFLRGIICRWDETPEGGGPTGTAIRTGKLQLVDIHDAGLALWRDKLRDNGIQSGISFPLKVGGLILGALTIFTGERSTWTKRTIVHLTNFAEQIALAMNATTNRQQLKLLTTGLESAANAIIITDRGGNIQWVNPAFLRLTGYAPNEAMSIDARSLGATKTSRFLYKALQRQVVAGKIWHGEMTCRRKDGSHYIAEMTITPVREETGELANFIAIIQDVTQRKQAERDMLEAREAVARAERLSSLGIMAAGIAHEINQPLNSLKVIADGMLYWYKQGKVPELPKVMENVLKISKQADRIDSIIKHMRSFVRSSQCAEPTPCDMNSAVEESLSLVGAQLAAHRIAVRTALAAGLPAVLANSTQLEEVVINLLINAMQSLDTVDREDKQITVSTELYKGSLVLEISDNGAGISRKAKNKIFEPFFTTKPAGEGMGLGLSIVHSIVTSYGGQISVKTTKQGEGATFKVEFPLPVSREKGEKRP